MNVWLVTIGEPVPRPGMTQDRLHRTGFFSRFLARNGHSVLWWTSSFDHFRKCSIGKNGDEIQQEDGVVIKLIEGTGYRTNVSFARLLDHHFIARRFADLANQEEAPDIIISALPAIELCLESVRYGRRRNIPVVLDMRDMWPDVFVDSLPRLIRPIARLGIIPFLRWSRLACAGGAAITGITDAFVDWGVARAGRQRGPLDQAFPMGYTSIPPDIKAVSEAEAFWDRLGVRANDGFFTVCFVGTIGRQFELDAILEVARSLESSGQKMRFVLCGSGDRLDHYRARAAGLKSVLFPGWVDAAAIHVLMRRSAVGLDPLIERYDFLATINNKAIEYLSASLPIISSPDRGVLRDLLYENECGMSVPSGNTDALTRLLLDLHGDLPRLQRMKDRAAEIFHSQFRAEVVYADFMNHLSRVCESYKQARRNSI